jgi:hypothetical protein
MGEGVSYRHYRKSGGDMLPKDDVSFRSLRQTVDSPKFAATPQKRRKWKTLEEISIAAGKAVDRSTGA